MLFNVFISQWTISVPMVSFLLPYVFSKYSPQFASPNVFYVMRYHQFRKRQRFLFCLRLYVFSMRSLCAPTVFILFIAVSVFRVAHRATTLHSDKAVESPLS